MTESQSNAAAKKKAATNSPDAPERGRPRIIRIGHTSTINENGQIELRAKSKQTLHGLCSVETDARILRLPPGTFFLLCLHPWWTAREIRLVDHVMLEECQVSCLLHAENPTLVNEGDSLGVMQPVASAKIEMKRGEDD